MASFLCTRKDLGLCKVLRGLLVDSSAELHVELVFVERPVRSEKMDSETAFLLVGYCFAFMVLCCELEERRALKLPMQLSDLKASPQSPC